MKQLVIALGLILGLATVAVIAQPSNVPLQDGRLLAATVNPLIVRQVLAARAIQANERYAAHAKAMHSAEHHEAC